MIALTKFEQNLFFKLVNLNRKHPEINWSYRVLASRWKVSVGIICRLFQKLRILGWLKEKFVSYRETLKSLTEKAFEAIKKIRENNAIRERFVNDGSQGKNPLDTYKERITITSPLPQKEKREVSEIDFIIERRQKDPDFPLETFEILRSVSLFGLKIYKMAANELLRNMQNGYNPRSAMGWMMSKMKKLKDLGL